MRDKLLRLLSGTLLLNLIPRSITNFYKSKTPINKSLLFPNDFRDSYVDSKRKWVIQTSVPRNENYQNWGDYHFAQEVVESLKSKGERAYVAFRTDKIDLKSEDIYLVIRGLYEFKPIKNALNVIWVISHPNQISKTELLRFDYTFAASENWADLKSKQSNTDIRFLAQATNPTKFKIKKSPDKTGIVFVGNAKHRKRKIVHDVLALGLEVNVIGKGWNGKIPQDLILGESISNSDLPELYSSACIVLNDHWSDMKRFGFFSNRIYDGIASGAFVISDEINGSFVAPNFYRYRTAAELKEIIENCIAKCDSGELESRIKLVQQFTAENSFDARVDQLINLLN